MMELESIRESFDFPDDDFSTGEDYNYDDDDYDYDIPDEENPKRKRGRPKGKTTKKNPSLSKKRSSTKVVKSNPRRRASSKKTAKKRANPKTRSTSTGTRMFETVKSFLSGGVGVFVGTEVLPAITNRIVASFTLDKATDGSYVLKDPKEYQQNCRIGLAIGSIAVGGISAFMLPKTSGMFRNLMSNVGNACASNLYKVGAEMLLDDSLENLKYPDGIKEQLDNVPKTTTTTTTETTRATEGMYNDYNYMKGTDPEQYILGQDYNLDMFTGADEDVLEAVEEYLTEGESDIFGNENSLLQVSGQMQYGQMEDITGVLQQVSGGYGY